MALSVSLADPDQAFGGSHIGWAKTTQLFKYPRLPATVVRYHTKVVTFGGPSWPSYVIFQGIRKSLKRVPKISLLFHKLHITENTVVVPTISYLQKVFKRYTLNHAAYQCLTLFLIPVDRKKIKARSPQPPRQEAQFRLRPAVTKINKKKQCLQRIGELVRE